MASRPTRRAALRTLLGAASVPLAASRVWAQEPAGIATPSADLRMLFFNTHLLPGIAQTIAGRRGQDDYRTGAIAAQLLRYDTVGLCEVFEAGRREEIIRTVEEASGNAYSWVHSPAPSGRSLVCGGLLLLTRHAIEGKPHFITYAAASRIYNSGIRADGLSAKGAIHARLRTRTEPGFVFGCFLTHLESVSPKARALQVEELGKFIAEHSSPERPMILMGDLNVEADYPANAGPGDSEYRQLVGALRYGGQPLVDLWPAMHTERGGTSNALANGECRRIDYVFVSPPQAQAQTMIEPRALRVAPFLDVNIDEGSLSDHAGLEFEMTLRAVAPR